MASTGEMAGEIFDSHKKVNVDRMAWIEEIFLLFSCQKRTFVSVNLATTKNCDIPNNNF